MMELTQRLMRCNSIKYLSLSPCLVQYKQPMATIKGKLFGLNTSSILPCIVLLGLLSSCVNGPKTVLISQDELQTKLASKLKDPITINPLLTLKIQHPLITLDESNNRVRTSIEVELSSPLRKAPVNVDMTLSGVLSYEASASQIQLTQTQLESFNVPELSKNIKLMSWVEQGVKSLHEQSLKTIILYQFKEDELFIGNQYYEPIKFLIKPKQLEVTLAPRRISN